MTFNSGNGLRTSSFRISLPTLGAISSIVGVFVFVSGWVIGYMTFKADLRAVTENVIVLRNDNKDLQDRVRSMVDDRQALSNRLISLEEQIKYISQGIAELKIAIVPKR